MPLQATGFQVLSNPTDSRDGLPVDSFDPCMVSTNLSRKRKALCQTIDVCSLQDVHFGFKETTELRDLDHFFPGNSEDDEDLYHTPPLEINLNLKRGSPEVHSVPNDLEQWLSQDLVMRAPRKRTRDSEIKTPEETGVVSAPRKKVGVTSLCRSLRRAECLRNVDGTAVEEDSTPKSSSPGERKFPPKCKRKLMFQDFY